MGLVLSSPRAQLSEDDIQEMKALTGFTGRQIVRLYHRFSHLDKGDNYLLSREDLERIPELAINPLGSRVLDMFFPSPSDEDAETMINFPKFLDLLSIFRKSDRSDSTKQRDRKLKFVFELYDADKDGVVTKKELFDVVAMMVGECEDNEMIQEVVVRTMAEATGSEDGPLDFDSFVSLMASCNVEQSLVVGFGQ
ncbi:calcineurin B homologous protein 1-like [Sycon ciliatum]|uniref:calcineurin B homologous protein 1-like n=1 Tax=Sycon ciliatum TaxID=27933 RepID=UPI0020AD4D24|eukprot:scpid66595/ scgid20848/ Calcium-binding protein p22; Calcineurin B homolog; Calcineurin homologous protein; Calcium-binding protein CHP